MIKCHVFSFCKKKKILKLTYPIPIALETVCDKSMLSVVCDWGDWCDWCDSHQLNCIRSSADLRLNILKILVENITGLLRSVCLLVVKNC